MEKIIAVCDPDERYVVRLSSLLEDKLSRGYQVHTFTSADAILRFSEENQIEMILISEEAYQLELEGIAEHLVLLSEDGVEAEEETTYRINRYQSVDSILREVICYMSDRIGTDQVQIQSLGKTKIIALYSPVGRGLQTTFGLALGQHLAAEKKVLFLPLEFFPGETYCSEKENNNNMMDLLYYFDCSPQRLPLKLPVLTREINGMDVIPGVTCFDLQERDGSGWIRLLGEIQKAGIYDYILLDLPQYMPGLLEILSACTRIYSIDPSDSRAQRKRDIFEKWLIANAYSEVVKKMLWLSFPWFEDLPEKPEDLFGSAIWPYVRTVVREDDLIR